MRTLRSILFTYAASSALLQQASALILKELPHNDGLKWSKRGDPLECLDLKSEESFTWGGADESQAALADLTINMDDECENILSMERFEEMLTSVTCTDTSIDLVFRDDETFEYAKAVWDWVNGADNNSFVMVAGAGDCGWNEYRQPFTVTTLTYDEETNAAHLSATPQDWQAAIHTYKLNVGGLPPSELAKRQDWSRDLSIDFNHQFPIDQVSLPMPDGVSVVLDLSNCSTSGEFVFQLTLETILFIPTKAEMSVRPQGIAATIAPSLQLTGSILEARTADLELLRIGLGGISIPGGILDIGPNFVLSIGATVGPLQGQATIEAGVVISLDDAAVASVDALGWDADQSGWTPIVQTTPLTVKAEFSAALKAFIKAELELTASALGIGFDLGLGLAPFIAADVNTVTAESAVCDNVDALAIEPSVGVDLIFDAHTPFNTEDDPLFSIALASLELPLDAVCLGGNGLTVPGIDAGASSPGPVVPPAIEGGSSSPAPNPLPVVVAAGASASASASSVPSAVATSKAAMSSSATVSPLLSSPSAKPAASSTVLAGFVSANAASSDPTATVYANSRPSQPAEASISPPVARPSASPGIFAPYAARSQPSTTLHRACRKARRSM